MLSTIPSTDIWEGSGTGASPPRSAIVQSIFGSSGFEGYELRLRAFREPRRVKPAGLTFCGRSRQPLEPVVFRLIHFRHCERSEAIQRVSEVHWIAASPGVRRAPRNDASSSSE